MRTVKLAVIAFSALLALFAAFSLWAGVNSSEKDIPLIYTAALGSYDIAKVDSFFDNDTQITCKGVTKTYKELRKNVIAAFEEKRFKMAEDCSYGDYSDGKYRIESFVQLPDGSNECYVEIETQDTGFRKYRISSVECNHDFFGYLFFGEAYIW